MNTVRPLVWIVMVIVLPLAAAVAQDPSPYVQNQNVVYAETDGVGLVMDVFVPTGDANGLGIVDIASGAWFSDRGKIEDHRRARVYDILCDRGYTVFAVRPGSITKFTAGEMVDHVKRAIRWIKNRHEEYGIDPERMGLTGASAGGHLACLTAVTAEDAKPDSRDPLEHYDTRVKTAVAFFPPTDFLRFGRGEGDGEGDEDGELPVARLLGRLLFVGGAAGKSKEQIRVQAEKISPARLVTSQAPPLLLIHGDADPLVPLQQSRIMLEALQNAGVEAELLIKPGGGHPWPTIHEEVAKAADWFDRHLTE